jgi:hypothetical protein
MSYFFKTFWQAGLFFGFFMGVFLSLIYGWKDGVWTGFFTGVLFGLSMGLFVSYQARKFTRNRPLSANEKLIKEGPANHHGNGGWIYLTDSRLFYISHKFNINNQELSIPLSEIATVEKGHSLGVISNQLILNLENGQTVKFVVQGVKSWINQIQRIL